MFRSGRSEFLGSVVAVLFGLVTATAAEQAPPGAAEPAPVMADPFQNLPGLEEFAAPDPTLPGKRVALEASFQLRPGRLDGTIRLKATIQEGWHLYSTTQAAGGPNRTTVEVGPSDVVAVTGRFESDRDPAVHREEAFGDLDIEEFAQSVTWSAPIRLRESTDPELVALEVTLNGQVCATSGACELVTNEKAAARFAGFIAAPATPGEYQDSQQKMTIRGHVEPQATPPGRTINLVLSVTPAEAWHVYGYAPQDTGKVAKPTLIVLRKTSGWSSGSPQAVPAPTEKETGLEEEPKHRIHGGLVTWTIPIEVPADAVAGAYPIAGSIALQACSENACLPPLGLNFEVEVTVGSQRVAGNRPVTFQPTTYDEVAAAARLQPRRMATAQPDDWLTTQSLPAIMALAFLAGLILNVMPCVLPVIGLKVMAFVQQAGGKRWEILSLNLWFTLGLLFVFWVLATLAAVFSKGWGDQFNSAWFTITMVAIVFAFGLAFLGVWHVPIPGFVGAGAMQGAAQQEGALGAFSKGILTTLLATPCAGPLIIPLVSWSISQPPWLTYLLFTSMGLGMAAPFLLVGVFPALISFLPRPGHWMNTVEQLVGFVLLATAIFFFNSLAKDLMVPTLVLLLGVGIACWWFGRTSPTGPLAERLRGWGTGVAVIAFFAWLAFGFLVPDKEVQLPWQPFSRVVLEEHLKAGRTVLVDFTADW